MTRPKSLRSRLLGIGFTAGKRTEAGGIRFAALVAAAFSMSIAFASIAAIALAYENRLDRAGAGEPVLAGEDTPASETLLMRERLDALLGQRQFSVYYLDPLGEDAPAPPGIAELPGPGEVYLSPALMEEGASEGIDDRYGEVVGVIDPGSLTDPGEYLAFVGSFEGLNPEDPSILAISEFSEDGDPRSSWGIHWLPIEQDISASGLIAIAVVAVLAPASILTVVASRVGSRARDRRTHLITVMGGRRSDQYLTAIGEALLPVTIGAVLSSVPIAAALAVDFHVPHTEYAVASADLRSGWWFFALCPPLAALIVLAASSLLGLRSTVGRTTRAKPSEHPRRLMLWATMCPVSVFVATAIPPFFAGTPGYILLNLVGIVGVMVTLPAAVAVTLSWMARRAERYGRRSALPAWLVIGARISKYPRASARQVSGVAGGAVLLCLTLGFQGVLTEQVKSSEAYLSRYGYQMVEVNVNGSATEAQIDDFLSRMDDGLLVVAATVDGEAGDTAIRFTGECEALEALSFQCPASEAPAPFSGTVADPLLSNWLGGWQADHMTVDIHNSQIGKSVAEGDDLMLVFHSDGEEVSVPELKSAAKVFPLGANVEAPGEGWLTGGIPMLEQSRWIGLFGAAGLTLLALVAGFGAVGEFLRHSRALAPLIAVTGKPSVFRSMAALVVWVPLLFAACVGLGLGIWTVRPLTTVGINLITPGLLAIWGALILAVGTLMWWWASRTMVKEAERWCPGNGD